MLTIGCHLSTSKGFLAMGETALSIGANTFAFFTRNPRGGKAKAIDPADAAALRELMAEHNFGPLVAHAPYTLNPCSDKPPASSRWNAWPTTWCAWSPCPETITTSTREAT